MYLLIISQFHGLTGVSFWPISFGHVVNFIKLRQHFDYLLGATKMRPAAMNQATNQHVSMPKFLGSRLIIQLLIGLVTVRFLCMALYFEAEDLECLAL
jgi:hypothetical protein